MDSLAEREAYDYEFMAMYDRYDGWGDPDVYHDADPCWDEIDPVSVNWLIASEYDADQDVFSHADYAWSLYYDADELPF